MGRPAVSLLIVLVLVGVAAPLAGQSLAEIARQEEERRKTIRTPGKVYTNESLRPEAPPSTPPAAPSVAPAPPTSSPVPESQPAQGPAPASAGQAASPQAPAPQNEAEWRKRVATAREALSRSQIFAEALQSRISALSTDFVNRDDPAQRDVIAAERQKALAELDRVRQEIQQQQKAMAAIQDDARRAGVPAGWVR
ncbi:MAG: hypothetical protein A3I61_02435 [Acidobacteria bacterium RIFCSPLOWO2_02_FULL_68_18]|nr:MAG: hypothetical protein A3I61_02435 [Acidobacteria bacterium RIFCSPLOWO2_02_FULL_68_18]OFW51690.1 MAG: hypothetical protein A3G77_12460 [Acidobacteria bacterium RIFCSPLOWO2_12_FULL_68_19]